MSKYLTELPSGQVAAPEEYAVSYVKNPLFTEAEKYETDLTGVAEKVAALSAALDLSRKSATAKSIFQNQAAIKQQLI